MIDKKLYYLILTLLFFIISVPSILSIIIQRNVSLPYINSTFIKLLLIIAISIMGPSYANQKITKLVGWMFSFSLLIGIQFKIMHWPGAKGILILSGSIILVNLVLSSLTQKDKEIINYLLYLFIFFRLLIILIRHNQFLWWMDQIICFLVTIAGLFYLGRNWNKQINETRTN